MHRRHMFTTERCLQFLTGQVGYQSDMELQGAVFGRSEELTAEQCRRTREVCVNRLLMQHPRLKPATDPTFVADAAAFNRWAEKQIGASHRIYVQPFEYARAFRLADILFVVMERSLTGDTDMQGVCGLIRFLLEVSDAAPFFSPARQHSARQALYKRLPQLRDIDRPRTPITRAQRQAWLDTQERRFGTALRVTAFPPQSEPASATASGVEMTAFGTVAYAAEH